MSSSVPQEINLPRLCRRRQREKLRKLKETLEVDEWVITKWEDSFKDHEPFPDGAFERLRINNIWEMVSEYLTNSTDIINSGLACPELFAERRVSQSLPEALAILKRKKQFYSGPKGDGNPKINCLGFRGVSKAWKKIFDEVVFERSFSFDNWYIVNMNPSDNDSNPDVCYFKSEESVDTALASLPLSVRQGQQSAFSMIRKLSVDTSRISGDTEANTFHAKLTQFLELFGNSVWLLSYKSQWSPHPKAQFLPLDGGYEKICEIVKLTPNLKALILEGVRKIPGDELSDPEIVTKNIRLKEQIMKSPFPSLSSLKYFHFDETDSALILAEIFRRCGNLKSVTSTFAHCITDEMAKALGNLELERYSQVNEVLITSLSEKTFNWPLKHITIWIDDDEFATTSFLWPFLNQFRSTLQTLEIEVPVESTNPSFRLDLPHLKFLTLESITPPTTIGLDDLLPLASLETLLVCTDFRMGPEGHNSKIYAIRSWGKLLHTNIWNCFQELAEFSIIGGQEKETHHRPSGPYVQPPKRPHQTAFEMEEEENEDNDDDEEEDMFVFTHDY